MQTVPKERSFKTAILDKLSIRWQALLAKYALIIALLLLAIVISIVTPRFLLPQNLVNVTIQISISTIIAVGMTFVILTGASISR
jgi:predicted ABC-type sugar transport system permease subunit